MKIESLQQIEKLLQFVQEFKLDMLEVDNIKIIKSKHDYPQTKPNEPSKDELEDLLYYSANQ